ncbi:unnamed protein product, partial [marine sediment metagenome]
VADIPAGWHLCDGTKGTPDLRSRFVVGAGDSFDVDDTGGQASHDHDFTADEHRHRFDAGIGLERETGLKARTTYTAATGTTDLKIALPLFYSLAFIMKIIGI